MHIRSSTTVGSNRNRRDGQRSRGESRLLVAAKRGRGVESPGLPTEVALCKVLPCVGVSDIEYLNWNDLTKSASKFPCLWGDNGLHSRLEKEGYHREHCKALL